MPIDGTLILVYGIIITYDINAGFTYYLLKKVKLSVSSILFSICILVNSLRLGNTFV